MPLTGEEGADKKSRTELDMRQTEKPAPGAVPRIVTGLQEHSVSASHLKRYPGSVEMVGQRSQ